MTLWKLQSIFLQKLYMYHTTFFLAVPTLFFGSTNAPCVIMIIFCPNYLTEGAHSL